MKRLILHIGTHKTGTTSIQYSLARSAKMLAEQNIIYPPHYANSNNPGHHFLAFGESNKNYSKLIKSIENTPHETIILSTELLSVTAPETISNLLNHYDTKVVCFLRRQDEYLESMYRELCKSSFYNLSSENFVNSVLAGDPLMIYTNFAKTELKAPLPADYKKLLMGYEALLGKDRVLGIPYDDPTFGKDALEKFCRATGINVNVISDGQRNVSFSPEIVEMRRLLDQHLDEQDKIALRPFFWNLNNSVASEQRGQSILSTELRRRILNHYAPSNAELHKRYIPNSRVKWLAQPYDAAAEITVNQSASLSVNRVIDLTAQLLGKVELKSNNTSAKNKTELVKGPHKSQPKIDNKMISSNKINEIGLNFAELKVLLKDQVKLESYLEAICECSLNSIRIPFHWDRIVSYETDGTANLDKVTIEMYHIFFSKLPKHIKTTAVVVGAPSELLREAYLGQQGFSKRYAGYLKILVENFDFIDDIELWNEPNASDFFVSIKGHDGLHRPWNASEYIEMVIKPGVEILRESGFSGRICGASFAENGLVGHTERRPAFAVRMRKYASEFTNEFSDNKELGSFYFQPNFARDVIYELKKHYPKHQNLPFDAFGIHPYPYFKTKNISFSAYSWSLTKDFLALLNEVGYTAMPVWITEVGARSVNLKDNYNFNAIEMADFVDNFISEAAQEPSIEKLFWYKYQDEIYDLKQEKSFGLFDSEGNKKPAYYSFRRQALNYLPNKSKRSLQDDFGFGVLMHNSSIDKSLWTFKKTEQFAYAIPCATKSDVKNALIISPGRNLGSIFKLQTRHHLAEDKSNQLKVGLRFRIKDNHLQKHKRPKMMLALEITNLADPKTGLFISISVNSISGELEFTFGNKKENQVFIAKACLTDLTCFAEIILKSVKDKVWFCCKDWDGKILAESELCSASDAFLSRRLVCSLEVARHQGDMHFIELSKFYMRRFDESF